MRVLYVTTYHRTGGWLAQAFAADSAVEVTLEEAAGTVRPACRGCARRLTDAVLASHEPGALDALELIEGMRAGGSDEPAIMLGAESEQELAPLCYEVGADAYVCVNATTVRNLLWLIARAVERRRLIRENRRLNQADQQRPANGTSRGAAAVGAATGLCCAISNRCKQARPRRPNSSIRNWPPIQPSAITRPAPQSDASPASCSTIIASSCGPTSSWARAISRWK